MAFGLDYITGPPIADMKAAGVSFVCRYLSFVNSLTQVKLLSANEAKALSAAGIALVSNYEWYANRAMEGFASGVQDAQIAASQHAACGGPHDRPIYFSIDVDVDGAQVADYFKGIASVVGRARTGAYGSYRVLKYLFDMGLIIWGWQTYAWSGGAWEPRAHIQQYQNGMALSGHSVDYNRSIKSDFGQWRIGGSMSGVPQGWHMSPDGTALVSPSSTPGGPDVEIKGRIRDYVLANAWPPANVALAPSVHKDQLEMSNPGLGSGWQQAFRWSLLAIPDTGGLAGKVVYEWLGVELDHVLQLYTSAQAEIAALKAQPAGLDPTKVANKLTALAQLGRQVEAEATQAIV